MASEVDEAIMIDVADDFVTSFYHDSGDELDTDEEEDGEIYDCYNVDIQSRPPTPSSTNGDDDSWEEEEIFQPDATSPPEQGNTPIRKASQEGIEAGNTITINAAGSEVLETTEPAVVSCSAEGAIESL